ncbi:MAG TPA: M56 family metallopeptidase [Sphingomicrobium sp.]|nr:M56 family metallopeptidase [Sphingomicrobium sp.]
MSILIAIALKSLLVAGLTLGFLALMKHRSAAERSWVAHIGLLALVIMALAPIVLPSWSIKAPALFSPAPAVEAPVVSAAGAVTHLGVPPSAVASVHSAAQPTISPVAAAYAIYAVPAAILLLITALALGRLIALQARAEVLVDGHWLTALARAQKRMGFKHGTALLTSNALASPISWGLMRPVILLNSRAVEASDEAEAIIAHELAHVARMDWVKLLLARVATALFWFNPLVWLLAREAHQLREEAADDAVLAADIPDTDYAQLLVGVARHECPGLLLGAHGVAPSRSSLARRVARVLDGKSVRGPVAGGFAIGVFVGAVLVAAPLTALTLTPAGADTRSNGRGSTVSASEPSSAYYPATPEEPTDLPHIIAKGVSTSVSSAVAAVAPSVTVADNGHDFQVVGPNGATVSSRLGTTIATSANGATVTVYPPDRTGRSKVVSVAANGATAVSYADAAEAAAMAAEKEASRGQRTAIEQAIALKVVGVTPEYAASMKSVLPQLRLSSDDLLELKAVGVTPEFVQELAREGYRGVKADDVVGAYAAGVRPDYIRGMAAAGYSRIPLEELTQLKAVGVTPSDVERFRRAGFARLDVDELIQAKTMGLTPEEIRASRDDP